MVLRRSSSERGGLERNDEEKYASGGQIQGDSLDCLVEVEIRVQVGMKS